jgi:radical SAM superfamily enzyme YgiQ (UPF0313 family)
VGSLIPSNTLAALHGLAADCAQRRVLGDDVEIAVTALDETHTRVNHKDVIRRIERAGGFGMVGMVGVQSNQFPRALDIVRPLRAADIPVVIGGFHVSGCLAMLPDMDPDLKAALDLGCSLFAGEAEGRLDGVLADAASRRLKPIYNYLNDLPGIERTPVPFMPAAVLERNLHPMASFDAGRGCPFQCSFCTIINVQGRKSRRRSVDEIEQIIRRHVAQGLVEFFITDDNFARNKDFEAILDRLIHLREVEGMKSIRFTIQVDTQCHRLPNFIEKCRRANVWNLYAGSENINPDNLIAMKKRQNKIAEYRALFLAAKQAKILTMAGFITGFPKDTPESILRDVEIIKRELPVDLLEIFFLTPLPGSEDHQKLAAAGAWTDPDLNKYGGGPCGSRTGSHDRRGRVTPADQKPVQSAAHRRPCALAAGLEQVADLGLDPLDTLLGRARARIPMAILPVAVRAEGVAKEIEALVASVPHRGFRAGP